jgi:hypothetical protein
MSNLPSASWVREAALIGIGDDGAVDLGTVPRTLYVTDNGVRRKERPRTLHLGAALRYLPDPVFALLAEQASADVAELKCIRAGSAEPRAHARAPSGSGTATPFRPRVGRRIGQAGDAASAERGPVVTGQPVVYARGRDCDGGGWAGRGIRTGLRGARPAPNFHGRPAVPAADEHVVAGDVPPGVPVLASSVERSIAGRADRRGRLGAHRTPRPGGIVHLGLAPLCRVGLARSTGEHEHEKPAHRATEAGRHEGSMARARLKVTRATP